MCMTSQIFIHFFLGHLDVALRDNRERSIRDSRLRGVRSRNESDKSIQKSRTAVTLST